MNSNYRAPPGWLEAFGDLPGEGAAHQRRLADDARRSTAPDAEAESDPVQQQQEAESNFELGFAAQTEIARIGSSGEATEKLLDALARALKEDVIPYAHARDMVGPVLFGAEWIGPISMDESHALASEAPGARRRDGERLMQFDKVESWISERGLLVVLGQGWQKKRYVLRNRLEAALAIESSVVTPPPEGTVPQLPAKKSGEPLEQSGLVPADEEFGAPASLASSDATSSVVSTPRLRRQHGPIPGTIKRYEAADRALIPQVREIMKRDNLSPTAAATVLADAGKIKGNGTPATRARRLAALYLREAVGSG